MMPRKQIELLLIILHIIVLVLSAYGQDAHHLPWCSNNAHTTGHWQTVNTTRKSFHCCGYGDYLNTISEFCGTQAYPKFQKGFCWKGSNEFGASVGMNSIGRSCQCDAEQGRLTVSQREKYEWIPSLCTMKEWDAQLFCSLLGNRTISLVGDSTMEQSSATLMSMIQSGGGGCAHQITNCRCDFLSFGLHWGEPTVKEVGFMFHADILVMSFGPHASDDGDLWSVWGALESMITDIRLTYPDTTFVWRSQQPGHVNCHTHSSPVAYYDSDEQENSGMDKDHWHAFPHYDAISRNFTISNNITYLDLAPLYLRPDGHNPAECLHYCLPGPIDLFSRIFLQMLYNNEL